MFPNMNERSQPALHLPRSPLIFVLGQVRFAPILSMEKKIPDLQDSLRKNGFPRLSRREVETVNQESGGKTKVAVRKQWEFIDTEKRASVLVDTEFIVFQVTRYEVFEEYLEAFQAVLHQFAYYAEPALLQRIGLRYIDLVVPTEGKALESYVSEKLRGFHVREDDPREAFRVESVSQTGEHSRFVHRYYEADRGLGFPPDLLPVSLRFDRDLQRESPFGLLDMDHFMYFDDEFSVPRIINGLWSLHNHLTKAFEASVTKVAMNEWSSS